MKAKHSCYRYLHLSAFLRCYFPYSLKGKEDKDERKNDLSPQLGGYIVMVTSFLAIAE